MVELVDTRDLKSLGRNAVPVRFRLRAPIKVFKNMELRDIVTPLVLYNVDIGAVIHNHPIFSLPAYSGLEQLKLAA